MSERDVIDACGEQGVRAMVAAFYRRVRHDDVIGPMYPADDWEKAEERLADFLLFRLGASEAYIWKRGHPRLRMRHVTFKIGTKERDRWLLLMGEAMDETGVPEKARAFLDPFFEQVAEFLRNRPELEDEPSS
jgi:hemoglobin